MYDKGSGGPREDVRGRDAHGGNDRVGKGADGELGDLSEAKSLDWDPR